MTKNSLQTVWVCSNCGDGPIGSWQNVCVNCGHGYCGACWVEEVNTYDDNRPELSAREIADISTTARSTDVRSEDINDTGDGRTQPNIEVIVGEGNADEALEEGRIGVRGDATSIHDDKALSRRAICLFENVLLFAGILEPPLLPGMTRLRWKCVGLM